MDAKFWKTLTPLLTKPGLVSKNYVEGKRQRYSNPFRFYLTTSIFFFLIISIYTTKQKYDELNKVVDLIEKKENTDKKNTIQSKTTNSNSTGKNSISTKKKDSIGKIVQQKLDNFLIPIPEKTKKKIIEDTKKDIDNKAIAKLEKANKNGIHFNLDGDNSKLENFIQFSKENPKFLVDKALDSLKYEKNFTNRFLYTKAKTINEVIENKNFRSQYFNQLLSYGSIGLFVFLPFFTLCIKLFYIRRKFTYVDHLIFVFHNQTVFFLLFSIYFLLATFNAQVQWIFIVLFLLYLFMAMLKFYKQVFFKTLIKYALINLTFIFLGSVAALLILVVSFALY